MYEFCLSLPYGGILALGGAIGYFSAGSTVSLAAGGGSGAMVLFFGIQSLKEYRKCVGNDTCGEEWQKNTKVYTSFSLLISAVLTAVMGNRHLNKGAKFMPAGLLFYMSAFMSLFYLYRLLSPASTPKGKKAKKDD